MKLLRHGIREHLSLPAAWGVLYGDLQMADDKSKRDGRDRSRVAGDEPYEIEYFAQKAGISMQQARDLINKYGNDRETLEREAAKL